MSKSERHDSAKEIFEDVEQFEMVEFEEDVDQGRGGSNSAREAVLFIDRSNGWFDSSSLKTEY